MKKLYILVLSLALVLGANTAYALNDPTFGGWQNLSDKAGYKNPTRVLQLVRFTDQDANDTSVVSGDAVVLDTVSDDGIGILRTTTSADGAFVGIACVTIPTADVAAGTNQAGRRNWGWVIVHGKADAKVTAGGTNGNSVGDPFITSTDAGTVTTVPALPSIGSKADSIARGRGGFFLDAADTTSTSVEVYVQAV